MKVTTIGVSVSKKLDTGYAPYIEYVQSCRNAKIQVPFGTRENSNIELNVYIGATVDENEDVETSIAELVGRANKMVDESISAISGISPKELPEEAFTVEKTEITREVSEI